MRLSQVQLPNRKHEKDIIDQAGFSTNNLQLGATEPKDDSDEVQSGVDTPQISVTVADLQVSRCPERTVSGSFNKIGLEE
ncbi:hypothetical protein VTO42DRAFT_6916 [Malbranchea cinnamomea]